MEKRYNSTNPEDMAKHFAKELDYVIFECGLKAFRPPEVPMELVNHPEFGIFIKDLIQPYENLRSLVRNYNKNIKSVIKWT